MKSANKSPRDIDIQMDKSHSEHSTSSAYQSVCFAPSPGGCLPSPPSSPQVTSSLSPQEHKPAGAGRSRSDPDHHRRGVAGLHQDDPLLGQPTGRRHQLDGRRHAADPRRPARARRHTRRPPEKNHEQCASVTRPDPRQYVGGVFRVVAGWRR